LYFWNKHIEQETRDEYNADYVKLSATWRFSSCAGW